MPAQRDTHPNKSRKKTPGVDAIAEIKPTRSYAQAVRNLESLPNMEKVRPDKPIVEEHLKLDRMRALAAAIGDPQTGLAFVHVAGSKGKGSVVEMVASSLTGCGYGVGVYTSPHLVDVRERIRIGDDPISEADFIKHFNAVIAAAGVIEPEFGSSSYFEVLTAMALRYFAEQAVDAAVLEVGLGGRLDATNIVTPAVTCVSQIQLEHTQILGNTLAEIAREKAGIFKPGVPALTVPQPDEVIDAMREVADRVELLGFETPEVRVAEGLARTRRHGRAELIWDNPRIIIDGAHTRDSVGALVRAIGAHTRYDSMVVVFGCAADKDIDGLLEEISRGADKIVFTKSSNPRAVDPELLRSRFTALTGKMSQVEPDVKAAINTAARALGKGDLMCVTGSFYIAGEAKKLFDEKAREKVGV